MAKSKSGIHGKAREIVGQYSLSSITDSKSKIVDFYRAVDERGGIRIDDGRIKVTKEAMAEARELADELSERMVMRDEAAEADYREIRAGLRGIFTISDRDLANIPDARMYLRSSDNFLRIGKPGSGMPIDTMYQELSAQYPQYFSPDVTNQAEQLMTINSVLADLKNSTQPMPREWRQDAREELRSDIIRGYLMARRRRRTA